MNEQLERGGHIVNNAYVLAQVVLVASSNLRQKEAIPRKIRGKQTAKSYPPTHTCTRNSIAEGRNYNLHLSEEGRCDQVPCRAGPRLNCRPTPKTEYKGVGHILMIGLNESVKQLALISRYQLTD